MPLIKKAIYFKVSASLATMKISLRKPNIDFFYNNTILTNLLEVSFDS